jgi:hypothetical protein
MSLDELQVREQVTMAVQPPAPEYGTKILDSGNNDYSRRILVGTAAMACLEATTSPSVKQLLVDTAGTEHWVGAGKARSGMASGRSQLGADIHEIDNSASRCGRLLDEVAGDADVDRATARAEAAPPGRRTQRTNDNPADAPQERAAGRDSPPPDDAEPPPRTRQTRAPREEKPVEPPKPTGFATGDTVRMNYKGEPIEAKIVWVSIEDKIAKIPVPGKEKPLTVDFDELTLVEADATFDAKPAPREEKPAAKKPSKWDDDADDGKSFQRK